MRRSNGRRQNWIYLLYNTATVSRSLRSSRNSSAPSNCPKHFSIRCRATPSIVSPHCLTEDALNGYFFVHFYSEFSYVLYIVKFVRLSGAGMNFYVCAHDRHQQQAFCWYLSLWSAKTVRKTHPYKLHRRLEKISARPPYVQRCGSESNEVKKQRFRICF